MSVFRIEKNKNYTAMSNYHLQDKNLSLKAIGLMSKMLSLPDTWDYSQAGLAKICKDGEDSISSALKELEKCGYLVRERIRDANGRMGSMVYHVYEIPKDMIDSGSIITKQTQKVKGTSVIKTPEVDLPQRENPVLVKPVLELPNQAYAKQEIPTAEEPGQLSNNTTNTNLLNIKQSITQSTNRDDGLKDRAPKNDLEIYERYVEYVKETINYDFFVFRNQSLDRQLEKQAISLDYYEQETLVYNLRLLDQVVGYIVDILVSQSQEPIKIGNELISREVVKSKLMKTDMLKVKEVLRQLATTDVKNPKGYAISMLYNA